MFIEIPRDIRCTCKVIRTRRGEAKANSCAATPHVKEGGSLVEESKHYSGMDPSVPGKYKRRRAGKVGLRGWGLNMMPELRHRCSVPGGRGTQVEARVGDSGCVGVSRIYASQKWTDVEREDPPLLGRCQHRGSWIRCLQTHLQPALLSCVRCGMEVRSSS